MKRALVLALLMGAGACRSKSEPVRADPAAAAAPAIKEPRVIASGQDHPWNVLVDATHVYWANKGRTPNGGSVARVAKTGGALEWVAGNLAAPYGLALARDTVIIGISSPAHGGISIASKTGASRHGPLVGDQPVWSVVATDDRVFRTRLTSKDVTSAPFVEGKLALPLPDELAGKPQLPTLGDWAPTAHAKTTGRPVGLAVDTTHVYWTDSDPGVVAKTPIAGGPITNLVTGGDKTTGLAVDATHVYWSEWGSGRIGKVPKDGGPIVALATDQKGARAIATDDARVYWTHPPSGSVRSVSKDGGPVFTHATGQKHPYSVTVDATAIYWANVDGDTVMAVDK